MAVYRSRTHDSLGARLIDLAIGFSIGVPAALVAWVLTLWWWAVHG